MYAMDNTLQHTMIDTWCEYVRMYVRTYVCVSAMRGRAVALVFRYLLYTVVYCTLYCGILYSILWYTVLYTVYIYIGPEGGLGACTEDREAAAADKEGHQVRPAEQSKSHELHMYSTTNQLCVHECVYTRYCAVDGACV